MIIPTVIEKTRNGDYAYDIYSRLLKDRILFIGGGINSTMANTVIAQMLFLEKENPNEPIQMFINSPGGEVNAGFAIYDTMKYIKCEVSTISVGLSASFGAILLAGGAKGKRFALPNSTILIHQPIGGIQGQASDIDIEAKQILKVREQLYKMLADFTGQKVEQISKDADRDKYFTAKEAKEYGLIDKVL